MRRNALLLSLALALTLTVGLSLTGCKKKVAPPAPAYTGPLTLERMQRARKAVKLPGKYAEALVAMEALVGKARKSDAKNAEWGLVQGNECHHLVLSAQANGEIASVGLNMASKVMKSMFDKCAAAK